MRVAKVLVVFLAVLLLAAVGVEARGGYILRFTAASIYPSGDFRIDERDVIPLGDGTTLEEETLAVVEADDAYGFCIDFERRFTDRFGLGVTIMRTDHDMSLAGSATVRIRDDATNAILLEQTEALSMGLGSVEMTPILVGANFHFGGSEKVDLYAGPFLGVVDFGDLTVEGERIGFKNEIAYGATLGLDVPFGQGNIEFSASARYMVAGAETDEAQSDTVELDPLVVLLGFGYRF